MPPAPTETIEDLQQKRFDEMDRTMKNTRLERLRDEIAIAAMNALIINKPDGVPTIPNITAEDAYKYADAMLNARARFAAQPQQGQGDGDQSERFLRAGHAVAEELVRCREQLAKEKNDHDISCEQVVSLQKQLREANRTIDQHLELFDKERKNWMTLCDQRADKIRKLSAAQPQPAAFDVEGIAGAIANELTSFDHNNKVVSVYWSDDWISVADARSRIAATIRSELERQAEGSVKHG